MAGGPFDHGAEAQEISEVNVVPLADVSLVLLIILLTLSPMMAQNALRIQTAARDAAPPPDEPVAVEPERPPQLVLAVSLTPHGIAVGGRIFSGPGDFVPFMRDELSRRADKKVFVSPHPDVEHGKVVHMLEMLKECGATTAALVQTQEEAAEVPAPQAPGRPPRFGWIGDL